MPRDINTINRVTLPGYLGGDAETKRTPTGVSASNLSVATGWGTHHEMELLVAAGLSPIEAIVAATSHAADVAERGESN